MVEVTCVETGERFPSLCAAARSVHPNGKPNGITTAVKKGYAYYGFHFTKKGCDLPDPRFNYDITICYNCENTNLIKCPLFDPDNIHPPKGAKYSVIMNKRLYDGSDLPCYIIHECPNFSEENIKKRGKKK